jgi:hypothetical protein
MTDDGIYLLREGETDIVPMYGSTFESEDVLQELIAQHPDLLAGREMGVPKREGGGDHWSVDHLLVDQDAIPTIVEVKRSSDTRIRREVVGQMLDYAANGPRYWTASDLRRRLELTLGPNADGADAALQALTDDPQVDLDGFLTVVEENLRQGRIRLVFLADVIPPELRSIVEFLNQQMRPAEVFAVELKQYLAPGVRTLIPRVIGATTLASQRKQSGAEVSYDELLSGATQVARQVEQLSQELAIELGLTTRTSKRARQVVIGGRTVFQFYPTWGEHGALEVNIDQLRRSGFDAAADEVQALFGQISPAQKVAPKYPWIDGEAALSRWGDVKDLVRDTLMPALR